MVMIAMCALYRKYVPYLKGIMYIKPRSQKFVGGLWGRMLFQTPRCASTVDSPILHFLRSMCTPLIRGIKYIKYPVPCPRGSHEF
jgi:hypothetical protein